VTAQADALRDKRREFALPGRPHDRLIALLRKILPAGIGAMVAVMVLVPLTPRGEVSFLLDRRKVAITPDRIDVDHAMYRGIDDNGRPFEVTAGRAVQPNPTIPIIGMNVLVAQLQMNDGPAKLTAPHGNYNFEKENVTSDVPVVFTASDGYRMTMSNISIDLGTRKATGAGGVQGSVPTGTFQADRADADLDARTVALEGNAHMRMVPGQMKMPQ
jgi:lipopolysaccharide export system protein LptC